MNSSKKNLLSTSNFLKNNILWHVLYFMKNRSLLKSCLHLRTHIYPRMVLIFFLIWSKTRHNLNFEIDITLGLTKIQPLIKKTVIFATYSHTLHILKEGRRVLDYKWTFCYSKFIIKYTLLLYKCTLDVLFSICSERLNVRSDMCYFQTLDLW